MSTKPSTAKEKLYRCPSCGHEASKSLFEWTVYLGNTAVAVTNTCPHCNHTVKPVPAKPKKQLRLKPMSDKTRNRYEANRGWRARFVKEIGECQNPTCREVAPWQWPLHVHEICSGGNRQRATDHRDSCLVLCDYCNANIFTDKALWPIERQCALKLLTDPAFYNLDTINRLLAPKDCADVPQHITHAKVAKFLELKR